MSHHFFFSYSRADHSPLVKRFFEDLCDTVRIESNLPYTQSVGFYEEIAYGPTVEWSDGAREALQDSGMMVCLLSPAYFHSERAGKEWQVFEMRRRGTFARPDALEIPPESLARIIVPVTWSQWHGPVPRVINEALAHPDHIHQRQALTTMFRSAGMFQSEYAEFVKTLANQIVEMTPATSKIPPLNPLPKMSEVHSAFHLWNEAAAGSDELRNQSKRSEEPFSEPEFVQHNQFKPAAITVSDPAGAMASNPQEPSNATSWKKSHSGKYSVFAISREEEILNRCCPSSVFDLKKSKNADKARLEIESLSDDDKEPPDLVIIDLDFEQPEIEHIIKLSERMRLPSEILLLSRNFKERSLKEFGGHTIVQKSDLEDDALMRRCAQFGRDRSDFRKNQTRDSTRFVRPVFLSYSHKDRTEATFLLRNFEARGIAAWSMDETLKPGDDSYTEIVKGLDEARILVSFISENYLKSPFCKGELFSFYTRVKRAQCEEGRPHLVSVLYENPDISEYDFIIKPYQYIKMFDKDFLIELQTLIRRIQNLLHIG